MVRRVSHASATLTETNAALRREIDERRRMETEREELLERERRASRLKDEFLATVSHELRTPLNAILGWSQILRSTPPAPAVLERAVASIDRNARAQTRLIEDLIDISRIVTGKLQLTLSVVDLRTPVEAAVEVVRPMAAVKDVALHVDLAPGPCLVVGDGERLQQVFWNLLSNAVKFTPAGGDVYVSLGSDAAAWVVRVRDTGIGIQPEFLPHIFERFRQADGSMTREHGGLGLGLAIARDLTQLHGGTITVESHGPGQGTEFAVRLAARVDVAARIEAANHVAPPLPSLRGVHVLVVDDSVDTLDVLRTTLTAAGAEVDVATSGSEALAWWQSHQGDVLLCDLAMPYMDGYEVLTRIRAIDAAAGRLTPAIAVSAHASEDQQARSIRAGFQQHIAKPCHPSDIVRAVAAAVERS
jgi:CheY-like chemotaxis protein